jgi:hypothetical protein
VSFVLAALQFKNSDGSYTLAAYLTFAMGAFPALGGLRAVAYAFRPPQPPPPSRVQYLVLGLVAIGFGIGFILYVMSTKAGALY